MMSVPFIFLAIVCIALGRLQIRKAKRVETQRHLRRWWGWMICVLGLLLMMMGVLLW